MTWGKGLLKHVITSCYDLLDSKLFVVLERGHDAEIAGLLDVPGLMEP